VVEDSDGEPPPEDSGSGGLIDSSVPESGFVEPIVRDLEFRRERNRALILIGLLAYLSLWSIGAIVLVSVGKTEGVTELVTVLAVPALPLLGIAIGSYFESRKR
jgi:hypothetical protein